MGRKITEDKSISGADDILQNMAKSKEQSIISPEAEPTENNQECCICIKMTELQKKLWKTYFSSKNLTLTKGIECAVYYMMNEEQNRNIKVGKFGIERNI